MLTNEGKRKSGIRSVLQITQQFTSLSHKFDVDVAESEEAQYQHDVFRTLLICVGIICAILSIAYMVPFAQVGAWPALIIGGSFLCMSCFCAGVLIFVSVGHLEYWVRPFIVLATWVVFCFGFLQSSDFVHIMALGACIVIIVTTFMDPIRTSYQWSIANIVSYIVVVALRSYIAIPEFSLGILQPWVFYGTPVAVLIIVTALGRVTIQHFKLSLTHSESARRSLEAQKLLLKQYAAEADNARLKAEQADQVKSAFLASMSHELRTPLNAVINFTKFVAVGDMGPVNDQQEEMLNEVVGSAQHLLRLINDVLDMSKIEAGMLTLFVEDNVNLNQILSNALATSKALLANKSVELVDQIKPDLPPMCGDRQRLLQTFLNILSNACKFTEQGQIILRAFAEGGTITVSVTDTGPGIPVDEQPLVFQAFKQTGSGISVKGGTGLGMPIAQDLVEAHGGLMWFDSQPGEGTTFYVTLPIKSEKLSPTLY